MPNEPRIEQARITAQPKHLMEPLPVIWVKLSDEQREVRLYDYYPDEISFAPEELIGLTVKEAVRLKFLKDKEFLQSSMSKENCDEG